MKIKYVSLAYALFIKVWLIVCNACRNIDSGYYQGARLALGRLLAGPRALAGVRQPLPGTGSFFSSRCYHALSVVLNTFTFESEIFGVFCSFVGFVGRNRYRLITDAVFENRLTDCVFSSGCLPTICFLQCRYKSHIYAPDSVLSFLLQNRCFVGFVGKKQIKLSGGAV